MQSIVPHLFSFKKEGWKKKDCNVKINEIIRVLKITFYKWLIQTEKWDPSTVKCLTVFKFRFHLQCMCSELKFYRNRKWDRCSILSWKELNVHLYLESLINFQSQSLQEKGKSSIEENPNDSEVPSSSGINSTKSQGKDASEGMLRSLPALNFNGI